MTTKEYCKKTLESKKPIFWKFSDTADRIFNGETLQAKDIFIFEDFQQSKVIKVEHAKDKDIITTDFNYNKNFIILEA